MPQLFDDINSITAEEWKNQIARDLKGLTTDQLAKIDRSGIKISPFYNLENVKQKPSPIFTHTDWLTGVRLENETSKKQNSLALETLNCGANSLTFLIDENTSVNNLLENIQADIIQSNFELRSKNSAFCDDLKKYFHTSSLQLNTISGYVQLDPVSLFVKGYHDQAEKRFDAWLSLFNHPLFTETNLSPMVTDASIYQNAGCTAVTELTLALAHLNEQLHLINEKQIKFSEKTIHVKISISSSFFETVSKLRALRILCAQLLKQYQLTNSIFIHAYSSVIDKTAADAHNNLIRTSIEGMAGIAGGANAINLIPYDYFSDQRDSQSARLAVSQLMIFKEEAFLADVADVGAGSFFIENYTKELTETAWKSFQLIEQKGGLIAISKSGELKLMVEKEASHLRDEYVSGKKILIGVNKFPNAKEKVSRKSISLSPSEKGILPVFAEEWLSAQKN